MWPKSSDSKRLWQCWILIAASRRFSGVVSRRSFCAPVRTASTAFLSTPLRPHSCPHRSVRIPVHTALSAFLSAPLRPTLARTASSATYPTQMRTATALPRDSHTPPQPTALLARLRLAAVLIPRTVSAVGARFTRARPRARATASVPLPYRRRLCRSNRAVPWVRVVIIVCFAVRIDSIAGFGALSPSGGLSGHPRKHGQ